MQKRDSTVHWIGIFQPPQKGIKNKDTREMKSNFNSKMLILVLPVCEHV